MDGLSQLLNLMDGLKALNLMVGLDLDGLELTVDVLELELPVDGLEMVNRTVSGLNLMDGPNLMDCLIQRLH